MLDDLRKNLAMLRVEKGLSQRQCAKEFGISQALLSHYENGQREPGLAFLLKASEYYDVSVDFLLGRTPLRETAKPEVDSRSYRAPVLQNPGDAVYSRDLINSSVALLFDLLGKLKEPRVVEAACNYLGTSIFRLYHILTNYAPDGNRTLTNIQDPGRMFRATEADQTLNELEYLHALRRHKEQHKLFPSAGYEALRKLYPEQYGALFQIVYAGSRRLRAIIEAHDPSLKPDSPEELI